MAGKKSGRRLAAFLLVLMLLCIQTGCKDGKQDTAADMQDGISSGQEMAASRDGDGERTDGSGTEENQVTGMGRYMESMTALPGGEEYMGRTIALLSDGNLAYFAAYDGLYVSSDGGVSWDQRRSTEELLEGLFEKVPYMRSASIAPNGSVGMLCSEFEEGKDVKVTLAIADAEGNNISISGNWDDEDYLLKVFWRTTWR